MHTEHAAGRHRLTAIESSVVGLVEDGDPRGESGRWEATEVAENRWRPDHEKDASPQTRDLGSKPGGADPAETGQGLHPDLRMSPGSQGESDEKASEWGSRRRLGNREVESGPVVGSRISDPRKRVGARCVDGDRGALSGPEQLRGSLQTRAGR